MGKLTPKQEAFALAYLEAGNASEAYRQAYNVTSATPKSVNEAASKLLKNAKVAARIAAIQGEAASKVTLSLERTLRQVASIAYVDPRRLFDAKGALLQPKDWPDDIAAAVASIEVTREGSIKVKLWDKNSALDKAMKHQGLFELDNKQKTDPIAEAIAQIAANNIPLPVRP